MSKKVTATILFVDIMDSIEIANYWDTMKYSEFLNEFRDAMQRAVGLWQKGIKQIKLVGDELVVFYCSKDISADIENAIQLANTLKILWYISYTNLKRVKEGKKILDLGVGINTGQVTYEQRSVKKELERFISRRKSFEGLPISLAKRIEGFSREGRYSRIMVGHQTMAELHKLCHRYECESMGLQKFKGMSQEVPVFELKSCYSTDAEVLAEYKDLNWAIKQLERIKAFDPENIWLLMTLIDIYGNKENYRKVERLCKEAIAIDDSVANVLVELADSLEQQKKYRESIVYCDKGLRLRPDLLVFWVKKSSCLIWLGLYDECIKTCEDGVESFTSECEICNKNFKHVLFYNMAAAFARKGNVSMAIKNIKKAIKFGGQQVIKELRADEDGDFRNLYGKPQFKKTIKRTSNKEVKAKRKGNDKKNIKK